MRVANGTVRFATLLVMAGCGVNEPVGGRRAPLTAYCTATVEGRGEVDVETDYLPHVVNCENGGAAFEALAAQAIAARSYLYYELDRAGSIGDGTGDQVYTCGREPSEDHYRAVEATSGIVLQYMGTQVAAFYVAGALQEPPDCRGGTDDPTNTERYVTYNEGKSGDGIDQTTLGFVDPTNHANRGCMSQNGSHCLAGLGWPHRDILRFYYGEDIEMVQAEGDCIAPSLPADAGSSSPDGSPSVTDAMAAAPDAGGGATRAAGGVSGGCTIASAGTGDPSRFAWTALVLLAGYRRRHRA